MPHVERKVEIKAPQENIFKILDDTLIGPTWNLAVTEVNKLDEGKFAVKSTVGDFTTIRTEIVENEKISMDIEGGIFTSMGYRLNPIGDMVEATIWGDFDDKKNEKMLTKAGEILLQSLKSYAEFLEEGGDPKDFDKKQITISP